MPLFFRLKQRLSWLFKYLFIAFSALFRYSKGTKGRPILEK